MHRNRFDLDTALAAWRRSLAYHRAFNTDDLDEMEQHLRDQIAGLTREGLTEEAAYRQAMTEMGDYATAEEEYRKVYWGKLRRRRQLRSELSWRISMLKNYVKIALRSLLRHKGYSFINIFGLAVGLACFILIVLFVQYERSYDRFFEHSDRTYRVIQRRPGSVYLGTDYYAVTPAPLAQTLVRDYAEVTHAVSTRNRQGLLRVDDRSFQEQGIWASEAFFQVFTFPLQQGRPETALAEPNTVVLTESLARKLFGTQDPLGQTLLIYQTPFTVTGLMADVPPTASTQFTFMASFVTLGPQYARRVQDNIWDAGGGHLSWDPGNVQTYFVLAEGADPAQLEAKLPELVNTYVFSGDEVAARDDARQYLLQALHDVHLHSHFSFEDARTGDIAYVYLFLGIALLVLLLACINYMNLAVARSIKRAREVGMRKVVGAERRQLIAQFLGESVLMTFMALLLAVGLVHMLLPVFGPLVERPIAMDYANNGLLLPGLLVLMLVVGLISGSYPAFYMASLRPVQVLKGRASGSASSIRLQRLLIVGQYTASFALVACGIVIYQQMAYIQNKELGYEREQVVTVQMLGPELQQNYEALRAEWVTHPRVVAVTTSHALPTHIDWSERISDLQGRGEEDAVNTYVQGVNYDYLDVLGLDLVAGRTFSPEYQSEAATGAILNETAVRALGWTPEAAIGRRFLRGSVEERTVIGVVQDFHFHSLHLPIAPLVLYLHDASLGFISAKVQGDDLPATLAFLEQCFQAFSPYPFAYRFLDEHFDELYKDERRLVDTLGFFTVLALLIASLGLFGLAAYAAEQRTKEIGVRKVLGASTGSIVVLLAKDFTRLVAVAAVLAVPVAYLVMQHWLAGFAYRIEVHPAVFLVTGLLALASALLTVLYQSIKAARADPIKSLRYE